MFCKKQNHPIPYGVDALIAVYVGARIEDKTYGEIVDALKGTHVKIFKTRMAQDAFRLEFDEVNRIPRQPQRAGW